MIGDSWLNAFLAIFAILNPIGVIPVFSDMTHGLDRRTRIKVFNVTTLTAFFTLLTMSLSGKWILERVFQIDLLEFRIAGGLLLVVLAIKYIVFPTRDVPEGATPEERKTKAMEMSVMPMAVPMLVGPGTIVTGIIVLDQNGIAIAVTSILAVFVVSWIIFQLSPHLGRLMGRVGRLVIGRVLWIFLAAIGVHLLVSGIRGIFGI